LASAGLRHDLRSAVGESLTDIRRSYLRVIIIWAVVLAALFAFQDYFS